MAIVGLPLMAVNRLQAIAKPSTLLLSASIEHLVCEEIPCIAYGTRVFDELQQPFAVFQVCPSDAYIELPRSITRLNRLPNMIQTRGG